MVWLPKKATKLQTVKDMKKEFLKTREGLKYLLKTFPSDMPVSIAIKKANNL